MVVVLFSWVVGKSTDDRFRSALFGGAPCRKQDLFESNSMQQPLVMKNKISIVECPNGSVAVECVPDALFSSANNKVVGDPWKRWWSETLLFLNDEKSLSLGEDLLLR